MKTTPFDPKHINLLISPKVKSPLANKELRITLVKLLVLPPLINLSKFNKIRMHLNPSTR